MTATETTPRAWVGCLACYNGGRLVGAWVDGTEAEDMAADFDAFNGGEVWLNEFDDTQRRLHLGEKHEEFWVFDHENYAGALTGECSPAGAQRLAVALTDLDSYPIAAVAAYISNMGGTDDLDGFEDEFLGEWDSLEAYAEEYLDSTGALDEIPEHLRPYFDVAAYARDLRLGGDVWTQDADGGGVFIFRNS
jgi:antirestriction protein